MKDFLNESIRLGDSSIAVSNVLWFLLGLLVTYIITKIILKPLALFLRKRELELGKQYAIRKLLKYLLYFIGFSVSLSLLGIPIAGLIAVSSALLIGIGIGLQQIFNDLFSGLIILFDRKVRIGDFVDINGMVGRVDRIDLRTSMVTTLDNIAVVVPNSKLISDNVINWSSNRGIARFTIDVPAGYDSDIESVRQILIHCATANEEVLSKPEPIVFLEDFGANSYDFRLMFWSKEFKQIERLKSDIRFSIDKAFKKSGIKIPYPQLDVHMKSDH